MSNGTSTENQPAQNNLKQRIRWMMLWAVCVLLGVLAGVTIMAKGIEVGDRAPEFTATAQTGETIRLADYLGKESVVVYFYPKDNTPGCTTQACSFRDAYEAFTEAGAVVIGISGDTLESHRQFADEKKLPFLLVSDQNGSIRKAFGVPSTLGIIPGRVTYVIDREGIVRMKFNSQMDPKRHIDEALQVVRKLNEVTKS